VRAPSGVPRLRDYGTHLLNGWVAIICATVLSVGAGWIGWQYGPATYTSTASVFVSTPGAATATDAYYGAVIASSRLLTFQRLANSDRVKAATADELGQAVSVDDVAVQVLPRALNSVVLDITVTSKNPELAQQAAGAVTDAMVRLSREMASVDTVDIEPVVVDTASAPQRQGEMWKALLTAGAVGLALACILTIAYGVARGRLLGRKQVADVVADSESTWPANRA